MKLMVPVGACVLTLLLIASPAGAQSPITVTLGLTETLPAAVVVDVIDGDTIRVDLGGQVEPLRYIGMDCPEVDPPAPGGPEAAERNRQLVAGQVVYLETDTRDRDRYDRLLRYVYLQDGTFVNAELVCEGYAVARAYPPDTRRSDQIEACQGAGQGATRGAVVPLVQQEATPEPAPDPCSYLASKNSEVFHHAGCKSAKSIKPKNLLCYATREEAVASGRRPCQNCDP